MVDALGPFNLVVAAWPCQGLSRANRNAQGLADPRSGLFVPALALLRGCQASNPQVKYIFENVVFAVHRAWDHVCNELGQSLIMDSALLRPAHR